MEKNDGKIDIVTPKGEKMRLTITEVAELERKIRETKEGKPESPEETAESREIRLGKLWTEGKSGSKRGD